MSRFRLQIPREIVHSMRIHAEMERPRECCGLLAGRIEQGVAHAQQHFPIRNAATREDEYETDARDLFAASKVMRRLEVHEFAVYHSHPKSAAIPSRKDLERNTYGDSVVHLILGFPADRFEMRGWWLGTDTFTEAELLLGDSHF